MNQRHKNLLLHPQELPHRFLHLGVLSPVAHLPQAFIDPLGRVTLFLRQGFVFFDDLSNPLKVGADLRLGRGSFRRYPGGSGWANIFFNVSQPIPSLRSISHLLLSSLETSSRIFVHQSMSVYTPLSSLGSENLNRYPKKVKWGCHSFQPPLIPSQFLTALYISVTRQRIGTESKTSVFYSARSWLQIKLTYWISSPPKIQKIDIKP